MSPVPHLRKWRSSSLATFDGEGLHRRFWRTRPKPSKLTMRHGLDILTEFGDALEMAYPGGKNGSGVYQKIINLMPPHDVYIEPFLGGGAVMRLKRPADLNIGCDLSASSIAAFRDSSGGIVGSDERGRRPSLELEVGDGIGKIERIADGRLPFEGKILIYCDPPYLMSTRTGKRLYEFEMDGVQHRRLLCSCMKAGRSCSIMISGYASSLYARTLKGWNSIQFESMTRGGYTKTEHLWFNFPFPVKLHDYRYLGSDFRERERIKRMTQRWVSRLDRMPILQCQALSAAIVHRQISRASTFAGNSDATRLFSPNGGGSIT